MRLFAWVDALRQTMNLPRGPVEQADLERELAAIRETIGEEVYAAAYAEGRAITTAQAIAFAGAQLENHDDFCASCHTDPESEFVNRAHGGTAVDLASFHTGEGVHCIDCHSGEGVNSRSHATSIYSPAMYD